MKRLAQTFQISIHFHPCHPLKLSPYQIYGITDLRNNRFTIIEIGLFYGGEHLGAKICRFLTFLSCSFQDGDFWSVLYRDEEMWKHFKYWLSSSNVLLKHGTHFPKDILINCKTSYLLNFFYDLISAFCKFQWMLRYFLLKMFFFTLIFNSFIFLIFLHVQLFVISILFYLNLRHFNYVHIWFKDSCLFKFLLQIL